MPTHGEATGGAGDRGEHPGGAARDTATTTGPATPDSTPAPSPTVGIVIPTFRRPEYLARALASVRAQTWTDLGVLVCDNAADEATAAVVAGLGDPRIRYLPRERDLGMMRNAIEGFRATRAPLVVKLDDDDELAPDMLATLVPPMLADPTITLAFAPFDLVDAAGDPLPERTAANERHSGRAALARGRHAPFTHLGASGAASLSCAVVRRAAVDWDAVPDAVATAYDRHVVLQCARGDGAAWFEPVPLARYRIHPSADSVTAFGRQVLGGLAADEAALAAGAHRDAATLAASAATAALLGSRELLRDGEAGAARRVLWRAVRRRPDRALVRLLAVALLPRRMAGALARHRGRLAASRAAGTPAELSGRRRSSWAPRRSSARRAGGSP